MNALHVFANAQEAAAACGAAIFDRLREAVAKSGTASVAFSGGSSPKRMFAWMVDQSFEWSGVRIFWVDERCVPPDHPDSNYGMTRAALLDRIRPAGVYRIQGELPPDEAAARYREEIISVLGAAPVFDAIHLGMGADSHTASLFPGLPEIEDRSGIAAAVWVPKMNAHRITLLPKVLLDASSIAMLVTGEDKAQALHAVFDGAYDAMAHPAQLIHREARAANWYVDRGAKDGE